ncbi:hypothetical protein TrVE_jg14031 [Triparma verrucosa]|uniref:WW domain-containing protein n=1 Tax=Triparma verrucosa TaxID=1606542 RepID=A0A9W7BSK9_9STRA|nr:hypothetical protein TrVE_jg14031 [Triparma verrucosa]
MSRPTSTDDYPETKGEADVMVLDYDDMSQMSNNSAGSKQLLPQHADLRQFMAQPYDTPIRTPDDYSAEIRLNTAHMGKLMRASGNNAESGMVSADEEEFPAPKAPVASNINRNAAAERIRAKKRMAQTAKDQQKSSKPSGLLNLETLKTLFSASLEASALNQNTSSIIYKKAKAAALSKQKRALDGVLKDDSDLSRIVKESERLRELMAKEDTENGVERPKSEPGAGRKKKQRGGGEEEKPKKRRKKKKPKQDFSRFQVDLRIVQPDQTTTNPQKAKAPAVNLGAVVRKANLSMQEFRLIDMRFSDVNATTQDLPALLYSVLEQYTDPSDEATANVISRTEAKAALDEVGMAFDRKDLETVLDAASENPLDENSVNFKALCAKLVKRYRKDNVCIQLGSAAARRSAQPFSNLNGIAEDMEMEGDDESGVAPHSSFLESISGEPKMMPNLPPLKIQQAQAIKHLRKDGNFDDHYGRETPHVLHSNTQVSIQELRKQLAMSERGLEQLNAEVKKGVQWVQLNCPTSVKNNRAKKYCKQWGVEKLKRFLMGQDASIQTYALSKWLDFVQYKRNVENVDKFIKVKTCTKIYMMLTTFCQRQVASAFVQWNNYAVDQRNREYEYCSIEIERLVRGFLGRRFAHEVLRDASACKIQNRFKCRKAARITDGLREERRRHNAARLLQNKYRGYTEIKGAMLVVQGKREQKGALCIQNKWRGKKAKDTVMAKREAKEMNDSASLLQRRFRGFEGRKAYEKKKLEKQRNDAACVIQRKYRGMQGQLVYAMKKLEKDSAISIQGCWRCYLAKKTTAGKMQLMNLRHKSAKSIQKSFRTYRFLMKFNKKAHERKLRWMKQATEEDNAARVMQGKARQWNARKKVAKKRQAKKDKEEMDAAAAKLQNRFRCYEAKKTVGKKRESKKLMEEEKKRRWQAQHDESLRMELEEQDKAARVMQGKARQFGARKQVAKKRKLRDQHKAAKCIQRAYRTHRFLMKFNKKAHERKLRWMKEAEEKAAKEAERERLRQKLELKEMHAAATKIQVVYRGRRARLKLEKRKNELAILEAEAEAKRVLAEQNVAAQRIANFMRMVTAKIKVRKKKEEMKKRLAEMEAAGDLGVAEIEKMKKEMQAEIQAMELSASMQAEQDKKDLKNLDKEHKDALAVEQALEAEQEENEKEHAALKIQNTWRKRRARQKARAQRKEKMELMRKMKEEQEKEEAERAKKEAMELQLRMQMEEEKRKKEAALLVEQNKAAVKIQGCYRTRLARKKVQAKKKAMLKEAEMIKKKAETMQLRIAREKKSVSRLKGEAKEKKMKEIRELEGKAADLMEQSQEARREAIKHGMAGDLAVDADKRRFEKAQAERIAAMEQEMAMNEAALKIQACWRIRKARQVLEAKKEIALMKLHSEDIKYVPPANGPPLGTFIRPGSIHRLEKYSGPMDHFGDDMEARMEAQAAEFVKRENAKAAKEYAERRKIEKEKAKQDFAIAKREFDLVFGEDFDIADKKTLEAEMKKAKTASEEAARRAAEEADRKIKEMEMKFNARISQLEQWEKRLEDRERGAESQKMMALHAQGQAMIGQQELNMSREREEIARQRRQLEEKERMMGSNSSAMVSSNPKEVAEMNSKRAITPSKRVEWKKLWDEEAKGYYYMNEATNQAQWERPEGGRGVVIIEDDAGGKSGGEVTDYDTDNAEMAGFAGGGGGKKKVVWQEFQDEGSGKSYWFNPETEESVWEDPNKGGGGGGGEAAAEAAKWVSHIDPGTGVAYWYNAETGETKWED